MPNYKDGVGNYKHKEDISSRVRMTADEVCTNVVWTVIPFAGEDYDTDSMHDNSTNNSRVIFKTAGKYIITFYASFLESTLGTLRAITIETNSAGTHDATKIEGSMVNQFDGDGRSRAFGAFIQEFSVNDYIEMFVLQNTGGNLSFGQIESELFPFISVKKL